MPTLVLDPTLTLALALRSLPGGYALLLGSGVSREASIPTGWEVVLDLIRRVGGADCGPDPVAWYREKYGEEPDYSRLIGALAATPPERRELLRGYFEPTAADLADRRKVPTRAHRAIAKLVSRGFIRMIVTTNFDHLLEDALRDEGVAPAVISTPDGVAGVLPPQHEKVTVLKLHGDYLDTRIKNTVEELSTYDGPLAQMLDRVLDEYGLVVCGWSGLWDVALRDAIIRAPNRRLSSYWVTRSTPLTPEAQRLVESRRAGVITAAGADAFFEDLLERITSLEELDRPHPISKAVAVASLKRYIPVQNERIRLHDLVLEEVERVRDAVAKEQLPVPLNGVALKDMFVRIRTTTDTLMTMLATGAYWGGEEHRGLWTKVVERLASLGPAPGLENYRGFMRLPAQLCFYSIGCAAVASGNDRTLADILLTPRLSDISGARECPAMALHVYKLVQADHAKMFPGKEQRSTPMSETLHDALREVLHELVRDDLAFSAAFDRFEYLVALAYVGIKSEASPHLTTEWGPIGCFIWRPRGAGDGGIASAVDREIEAQQEEWLLLRAGLFQRDVTRLASAKIAFDDYCRRATPY